jgi:arsenate reductase
MTITIYHNPDCGTPRNTLVMIRRSGEEPEIIETTVELKGLDSPSRGRRQHFRVNADQPRSWP